MVISGSAPPEVVYIKHTLQQKDTILKQNKYTKVNQVRSKMALPLPRFILLKSTVNNKYLRYRKEKDSNHGVVQFSQDEKAENPEIQYGKFEVQKSETMEGYVHIRTCYNNKYLIRKSSGDGEESTCIAAEANEPEEDPSKLSCTLFKPVLVDDNDDGAAAEPGTAKPPKKIRLVHTDQLGEHVCVALSNENHDLVISSSSDVKKSNSYDQVFEAYDATGLLKLPDRVAFTANNEKIGALTTGSDGESYLEFKASDIGERGVVHVPVQMQFNQELIVQFRNTALASTPGKGGWRFPFLDPKPNHLIVIQSHRLEGDLTVVAIRLGANQICIRNWTSPQNYAHPVSGLGMQQALGLSATSITNSAIFDVTEPIRFRQVSNMEYDLGDSRVYNVGMIQKYRDARQNGSSVDQTGTFGVSYTVTRTTLWGDSVTISRSTTASMSVSIPFVNVGFGVELSSAEEKSVTWGSEVTESETVSYEQNLTIPPGKKITLTVMASRAQCDVPYTCRVSDVVSDGETRVYTKTDGLFTGVNEFKFETFIDEEDI